MLGLGGCAAGHYVESTSDTLNFFLKMPEAKNVSFASSIDNYTLHSANENSSGTWQVTVPLQSELKYFYIVDDSVYLPDCRFKETDDFGSENCLYINRL
jgi:1,4-alpha-glucan branching enzyme